MLLSFFFFYLCPNENTSNRNLCPTHSQWPVSLWNCSLLVCLYHFFSMTHRCWHVQEPEIVVTDMDSLVWHAYLMLAAALPASCDRNLKHANKKWWLNGEVAYWKYMGQKLLLSIVLHVCWYVRLAKSTTETSEFKTWSGFNYSLLVMKLKYVIRVPSDLKNRELS